MRQPIASAALRLIANLFPFAGCLWLDWPVLPIALIYWFENVMTGVTNVLKMGVVANREPGTHWINLFKGAVAIVSFIFVYGLFTTAHGMAVVRFLDPQMDGHQSIEILLRKIPEWLLKPDILGSAAAMAVSYLYSFYVDFIVGGQWRAATMRRLANDPYGRIIKLHLGIMIGAFVLMFLDSSREIVAAAILIKAGVDLNSQLSRLPNGIRSTALNQENVGGST